jgi:Tfp pilus assembly protein PilF
MFNEAIALDPDYASAYAGLADLYDTYHEYVVQEQKCLDLRQKSIDTAFKLAPNSAYVNTIRGLVYQNQSETEKAYEHLRRALEINPSELRAIFQMGVFLGLRGLHHQAVSHFKVKSVQKKQRFYSGIQICRIARIQPIRFLIRAIRKIRIQKAFSCLVPARPGWVLCKNNRA